MYLISICKTEECESMSEQSSNIDAVRQEFSTCVIQWERRHPRIDIPNVFIAVVRVCARNHNTKEDNDVPCFINI